MTPTPQIWVPKPRLPLQCLGSSVFFPGLAAVRREVTAAAGGGPPAPSPPPGSPRLYLDARLGLYTDVAMTAPVSADGDAVAAWADQSGNSGNFLQSTSGNRPLYKVNIDGQAKTVQFDGINDYLTGPGGLAPTGDAGTFFVLVRRDGLEPSYGRGLFSPTASAGYLMFRIQDSTAKLEAVNENVASLGTSTGAVSDLTWTQFNIAWDGTAGTFRLSKSASGSCSSGSAVHWEVRYVGGDLPNGVGWFKGQMAAIVLYDGILTALTTPKRTDVEDWITSEFGV